MTEDLTSLSRLPARYALARRGPKKIQPSTAIALVVLFALAVIVVSIGIAQAETLGAMVEDETGRLALFGLTFVILAVGGITAAMMWLTAPGPRRV
jgi:hypothetical protein